MAAAAAAAAAAARAACRSFNIALTCAEEALSSSIACIAVALSFCAF